MWHGPYCKAQSVPPSLLVRVGGVPRVAHNNFGEPHQRLGPKAWNKFLPEEVTLRERESLEHSASRGKVAARVG